MILHPGNVVNEQLLSASLAASLGVQELEPAERAAALVKASLEGAHFQVQGLLDQGADPNATATLPEYRHPVTALSVAAAAGHKVAAMLLLRHGARRDEAVGDDALTPLYLASQFGHDQLVSLLICAYASVDRPSADGATPLHVAAHFGHASVVSLLLRAGADAGATTRDGRTPLDIAAGMRTASCDYCAALLRRAPSSSGGAMAWE